MWSDWTKETELQGLQCHSQGRETKNETMAKVVMATPVCTCVYLNL